MKIDQSRAEDAGIILVGAGILLVFAGIDGPLIAGSILCGSILICRCLQRKGIAVDPDATECPKSMEQNEGEPDDTDNFNALKQNGYRGPIEIEGKWTIDQLPKAFETIRQQAS